MALFTTTILFTKLVKSCRWHVVAHFGHQRRSNMYGTVVLKINSTVRKVLSPLAIGRRHE